jgi:hypothetical protein
MRSDTPRQLLVSHRTFVAQPQPVVVARQHDGRQVSVLQGAQRKVQRSGVRSMSDW